MLRADCFYKLALNPIQGLPTLHNCEEEAMDLLDTHRKWLCENPHATDSQYEVAQIAYDRAVASATRWKIESVLCDAEAIERKERTTDTERAMAYGMLKYIEESFWVLKEDSDDVDFETRITAKHGSLKDILRSAVSHLELPEKDEVERWRNQLHKQHAHS